ncbi:peptidoglycan-binding protein [Rhodoligotrophos defluvii]|uniref:peptidoglycan-binding protein n=1 Tax=Rhodoligotrophos defluvii TaxID=2561934 RepID=UPI0010C98FC1|nr:peptidoglycan-binding protein [Rhodoligotrophos defluvii]
MVSLTLDQLKTIAPRGKDAVLEAVVDVLRDKGDAYGVTTPLRIAHFLAQAAHESDGFKATEEYASGSAYEGRLDLGNTEPGDGVAFKGRGIFMLTGRNNYARFGEKIGEDLVGHPQKAAEPAISVKIALEYWKDRDLNGLADQNDFIGITRKINGGVNGFANRKYYFEKAGEALGGLDDQVAQVKDLWGPGERGDHIVQLQTELNKINETAEVKLDVDGKFGRATLAAIREFEHSHNLPVDGIADPDMRAELHKAYSDFTFA